MNVVSFMRRTNVPGGNGDVLPGAGALFQGTTTRVVGTAEAAAGSKKKEHLRRRFYIIRKNAESSFGINVDHCKCIIGTFQYRGPEQSERLYTYYDTIITRYLLDVSVHLIGGVEGTS